MPTGTFSPHGDNVTEPGDLVYSTLNAPDDTWALCMMLGSPKVDLRLLVTASENTPVKTRLAAYHERTAPLLPYYKKKGSLRQVDGMADIDTVTKEMKEVLTAL